MEKQKDCDYYLRKANQEYEMAGLASQNGDKKAAALHTIRAKEYDLLAKEQG